MIECHKNKIIAGLVPFTTIDYPGCLSAVLFLQGCPLKCPFCHNPNLQPFDSAAMSFDEVLEFLKTRRNLLDAVVLSGGEPLAHSCILELIRALKQYGFKIAVHTSGIFPERLKEILPELSWVGLDIKAPWPKYNILTGRKNYAPKVMESLKILTQGSTLFEARTTCDPRYLTLDDIYCIAAQLDQAGCHTYTLQKYRTFKEDINPPCIAAIESFFKDDHLLSFLKKTFSSFTIR